MNIPSGSLDLVRIRKAIYDWIYTVTLGVLENNLLQIVWMDQSEMIPPRPFVGLKITYGPAPIARRGNFFLGAVGKPMNVGIQMEATLSIQVYGNTQICPQPLAMQMANDINTSLMRQTILDALKVGGVSVQEVGKVRNLSALEESRYEERAGFEVGLGMVQNLADNPGTIGTVNVDGDVSGKPADTEIILP